MSLATNGATAAPWADLLPELCRVVHDRLDDPISILRFPAACAGWAAACKENPRRLRSGAPTLLTSGMDPEGVQTEHGVDAGAFGLHDVSAAGGGRSFLGEAAGLKGRPWIGGKGDWLVTTDYGCNVELFNPVTGDRVPLPSFETTRGAEVGVPGYLHVSADDSWHRILKVTLCQTPAHPGGYLAVALFSGGFLASTAAGDKCWTALKNHAASSRLDLSYMDAIVLEGKLFAVNEFGRVYSWDMMNSGTTEPTAVVVEGPEIELNRYCGRGFYLATSSPKQLLLICIHGADTDSLKDNRTCSRLLGFDDRWSFYEHGMSLHELDAAATGGAWRRVTDLGGDRALFLGANCPFYITVPPGSEKLKANCVYLADTPSGYDAGIFDLNKGEEEDGYVDRLAYSLMADPLQMPMWFRPTAHPRLLDEW